MAKLKPIPQLDLFKLYSGQDSIVETVTTDYRPTGSVVDNASCVDFVINTNYNEYVSAKDLILSVKLQVEMKKQATAIATRCASTVTTETAPTTSAGALSDADWKNVNVVLLGFHSLWQQVDLFIGDTNVNGSSTTYPYKAYLDCILGRSMDSKESWLSAAHWYLDQYVGTSVPSETGKFGYRHLLQAFSATDFTKSKVVELCGPLFVDLFQQEKLLLGGIRLRLRLYPNRPQFYINSNFNNLSFEVKITDYILSVTKHRVATPIVDAHNRVLMGPQRTPALYPISRSFIKTELLTSGSLTHCPQFIFLSRIPRSAVVCFVKECAFSGDYTRNPFNFEHFDLNYLVATVDGVQFPKRAYTPDFESNLCAREYLSLFQMLGQMNNNNRIGIDLQAFKEGFAMFGFNFTPDFGRPPPDGYWNPSRIGNLSFEVRFKKALPCNVVMIVRFASDEIIAIDKDRNGMIEF